MLNEKDRDRAASLLLEAERSGVPTTQLDQVFPDIEIADAYAIQKRIIDEKLAAGAKLRGHKIGLTSKAMQSTVGIDEPDYGHLLDTMFYQDGETIPTDKLIVPRVEVELAFVLGKPLRGPDVSLFDVLDATDYVVPALHDTGLAAGQIVLAGSFTRTVAVTRGDTLHADYGKLGSISVHFS